MGALINREVIISNRKQTKWIRSGVEERLHDIEAFAAELGCMRIKEDRREFLRQIYEQFEEAHNN
jgi:hypothetical protein